MSALTRQIVVCGPSLVASSSVHSATRLNVSRKNIGAKLVARNNPRAFCTRAQAKANDRDDEKTREVKMSFMKMRLVWLLLQHVNISAVKHVLVQQIKVSAAEIALILTKR
ncbi:hypothetical protein SELMODRAFT_418356 [Selaginella moellendorffii]|uniref:Uncharacterized protein n=1 Tax=Selaginella moellendorffii TaxID=88036 RepID=D8S5G3_SELML|nr:hypothetical protein SELMODRAFT_418356 [Selaginella moellendorffii]